MGCQGVGKGVLWGFEGVGPGVLGCDDAGVWGSGGVWE